MASNNANIGIDVNKGISKIAGIALAVASGYFCSVFKIFDPFLAGGCGFVAGYALGYVNAKTGAIAILVAVLAFVIANVLDHERTTSKGYPLFFMNESSYDVTLTLRVVDEKKYNIIEWKLPSGFRNYLASSNGRLLVYNPVIFYEAKASGADRFWQGDYVFKLAGDTSYHMRQVDMKLGTVAENEYYSFNISN